MDRTITAIKEQKKNKDRVAVFLDDEFAFGLTHKVAKDLFIGQAISDDLVATMLRQDELENANRKLDHFIGYRERSEEEAVKRLVRAGYSEGIIQSTIARFKDLGLIDDHAFARNWVANRSALKPRGRKLLQIELRQKGIDDERIMDALQGVAPEEELAFAAAKSYSRRLETLDRQSFVNRLKAHLLRKGFSFEIASITVNNVWSEIHQNEERSQK